MNDRRRPPRRGRGPRPHNRPPTDLPPDEDNPYRDESSAPAATESSAAPQPTITPPPAPVSAPAENDLPVTATRAPVENDAGAEAPAQPQSQPQHPRRHDNRPDRPDGRGEPRTDGRFDGQTREPRDREEFRGGRRGRRNRGRDRRPERQERPPIAPLVADSTATGWFDVGREGGYIRRAGASYLAEPGDPFVPSNVVRQYGLRRSDAVDATVGRDPRGRLTVVEVTKVNGLEPAALAQRAEFASLVASYPDRKLFLETGRPAKGGPELTRRAIDLIAPIGFGQRALIVAPARAGKTMLMQAITEGVALNHPQATLLILLVDERPEEVSEAISWGVGEVIASSFDMPAERHRDVVEMTLEHARRLVEMGKDVVIVLDSLTRMARAYNTVERGTD